MSCSVDSSSTIGSPLSSPKCVTSLNNNSKQFTEFNSPSISLLSPSSSSTEMMVSAHPSTAYSSQPMTASNSYTSSTLNSPSAVFSSCMFPEIPAFSPGDSAHIPASGPAYAGSGAELRPVGVTEAGGSVGETGGCGPMTSTTLKRSISGTFSDDDVMASCSSKSVCSDGYQQKAQRSKGLMLSHT